MSKETQNEAERIAQTFKVTAQEYPMYQNGDLVIYANYNGEVVWHHVVKDAPK